MEFNWSEWNGTKEWMGMECNIMEQNGMKWNGVEYNGMEFNRTEWNGMKGMEEMEGNGTGCNIINWTGI